ALCPEPEIPAVGKADRHCRAIDRQSSAREGGMNAADISRQLAHRVDGLVLDLLPAGHREGHEWRCGSVAGEAGDSLGVHLTGHKRGVWADFSTGHKGDALDLVRAVLRLDMGAALRWSRRWLGLQEGEAALPPH